MGEFFKLDSVRVLTQQEFFNPKIVVKLWMGFFSKASKTYVRLRRHCLHNGFQSSS